MDPTILGLIIGIVLVVVTVFLILSGNKPIKAAEQMAAPEDDEKPSGATAEDDLVLIEGIGPKVAEVLKRNGIKTFANLAATPVPTLQKILEDNGLRFMKPDSWPEQGRLAAAGLMDELKQYQEKLVGGR